MAVLLRCAPLEVGVENEHTNLLNADVVVALSRYYHDNWDDPKGCDEFVDANAYHITFVINAWIRYMWDLKLMTECSHILELAVDVMDIFRVAGVMCSDLVESSPDITAHTGGTMASSWTEYNNRLYRGLRFLTRTALAKAPWLEKNALSTMIGASKFNRNWYHSPDHLPSEELDWKYRQSWFCNELLPIIREEFGYVFGFDKLSEPDESELGFIHSNGAVQDACTNAFCKWLRVTTPEEPEAYKPLNPRRDASDFGRYIQARPKTEWRTDSTGRVWKIKVVGVQTPCYFVRPIVVPKSFKAGRVVCPEKAEKLARQKFYSEQLRKRWRQKFPTELAWEDQQLSRDLVCRRGYSSADQSSASDCIRRNFLKDVFPGKELLRQLLDVMPTHYCIGKRVFPMTMFGTMGSPLTFDMLGGSTLALVRSACRWANILDGFGDKVRRPHAQNRIVVVGDDAVLPDWAFGTFLALLELCSLKPNMDKSYSGSHPFREACGYEGFDTNADVIYVPRGTVFDNRNGMTCKWDSWVGEYKSPFTSLCALSNRITEALGSDSACGRYLQGEILAWCPVVRFDPFHNPGTIWGLDRAYIHTDMRLPDATTGESTDSPYAIHFLRRKLAYWVEDEEGNMTMLTCDVAWYYDHKQHIKLTPWTPQHSRLTVTYTTTSYVPDQPKAVCLCHQLPDSVLRAKRSEYAYQCWLRNGPFYEDPWCELAHTSQHVDYMSGFRMKPVTRIDTKNV